MKTRQYKLKLHYQPFHPGLERTFLEDLRESRLRNRLEVEWLVVPGKNLRRRLRQRASEAGIPTFNLRFVLFPELAGAILARSLDSGPKALVPRGADRLILDGLMKRGLDPGSWFGPIREHGGFLNALERTIGDLFHAGVDPDRFQAAVTESDSRGLSEVAGLYRSIGRRFNTLGMEPVAGRILRAAASPAGLPAGHIRIYGFYDLNGAQRALIRALAASGSMTAYVPRVSGEEGAWVEPHLAWLASIGFPEPETGGVDSGEASDPAPLRWFSAAGERREAEEVVRRILDLLGTGVRPDRVAVLYRDADPYADLLLRLFERAGIPADSEDRSPLSRSRSARGLRLLVQAARSNGSRRAVLDFFDAAAPLCPAFPEGEAVALVARWEAWTMDAGITRGHDVWTRRLARLSDRLDRKDDEGGVQRIDPLDREALNRLRALVPPFLEALIDLPGRTTWAGLAQGLLDLGDAWLSRDAAWDDVREAVLELGRLDAIGEPASLGAFETLLEDRLDALPADVEVSDRARVFVGGAMAARGLSFDHVFIVGLTEKVFPRPPRRDPLLPDAARIRIPGVEGPPALRRDSTREEAFLFELALASGANRTLSWSRIEPAEARPRLPSAFLLKAVSRHRNESLDYTSLDETTERIPLDRLVPAGDAGRAAPRDPVPRAPARFIDAGNSIDAVEFDRLLVAAASGAGRLDRLAGLRSPNLERSVRLHLSRWRSPAFTAADGFLRSEKALAALSRLIGRDRAWSASRLEKYAGCPFRFFIENILGVERLEPPETLDRITPLDRGSLIHAILRRFLGAHGERLQSATPEDLHRELSVAARVEMSRVESETPVGYPLTWRVDADRLLDDLSAWLDFEIDRSAGLVPRAFELAFGTRSADPGDVDMRSTRTPVHLDIPDLGRVAFQGRIDRVDVDASGAAARVTDYKTGRKRDALVEVGLEGGLHLQLPIYLLALREFFPDVRRAEAEYLFLGDDPKSVGYAAPDYPKPGAELPETLGVLLQGITGGNFFAYPGRKSGCDPCRHGSICGLRIEDRFALKKGDPAIAEHLRLRGDGEDA